MSSNDLRDQHDESSIVGIMSFRTLRVTAHNPRTTWPKETREVLPQILHPDTTAKKKTGTYQRNSHGNRCRFEVIRQTRVRNPFKHVGLCKNSVIQCQSPKFQWFFILLSPITLNHPFSSWEKHVDSKMGCLDSSHLHFAHDDGQVLCPGAIQNADTWPFRSVDR